MMSGKRRESPIRKKIHKKTGKDNKDPATTPLGLRTDFGYPRDFFDYYVLGKELGHGQFGTTYNCVEKKTGKRLACKTILKKQVSNMSLFLFI